MLRNQVADEELTTNDLRVHGTVTPTGITVTDRFSGASNEDHHTFEDLADDLNSNANRDRERNCDEDKSIK